MIGLSAEFCWDYSGMIWFWAMTELTVFEEVKVVRHVFVHGMKLVNAQQIFRIVLLRLNCLWVVDELDASRNLFDTSFENGIFNCVHIKSEFENIL